jgi:hypothetical protein
VIKFVAIVDGKQFETLLLAARAVGVTPQVDVVHDEEPQRQPYRRRKGKRSTKKVHAARGKSKPKRHPPTMQVKMGPPPEGPKTLVKVHRALVKEFNSGAFRKGDAKRVVMKRVGLQSPTAYITKLMDSGSMLAA